MSRAVGGAAARQHGGRTVDEDVLHVLDPDLAHRLDDGRVLAADLLGPQELLGLERRVDVGVELGPGRDVASRVGRLPEI